MFVQEKGRPAKAGQADALHREDLELLAKLQKGFSTGEGNQLVANLVVRPRSTRSLMAGDSFSDRAPDHSR